MQLSRARMLEDLRKGAREEAIVVRLELGEGNIGSEVEACEERREWEWSEH